MAKKSSLEVYALAVCFLTVACFAIVAGTGLYNVIRMWFPTFTMDSYTVSRHANNDKYWQYSRPHCTYTGQTDCGDSAARLPEPELSRRREESFAVEVAKECRVGVQGLVQTAIFILVITPVFAAHWLIAQRARERHAEVA